MKLASLLCCLLAGPAALCQGNKDMTNQQVQQSLDDLGNTRMVNSSRTFDNRLIATRGTPFYATNWLPGEVTIIGTKTVYRGQFKLDVMNNRLMVKQPTGDSIWVSSDRLNTITLNPLVNDQMMVHFQRFPTAKSDQPLLSTSLVRVLHEGTYGALVQLPIRQLYKAQPNTGYSSSVPTNEIRDESVYYVVRPNQTTEKVKLNRRSLADALGETGRLLNNHARANNLSLRSEREVIDALKALPVPIR